MNTNQCDCCKEIWNQDNLIKLPISKNDDLHLYLCPDCNKKFHKMYQVKVRKTKKKEN